MLKRVKQFHFYITFSASISLITLSSSNPVFAASSQKKGPSTVSPALKVVGAVGLACVVGGAALYLLSKASARDSAFDDCRAASDGESADQKNNPDFTTTAFRVENYKSPLNEEAPSRSNVSSLLEMAGESDLPWKERMINAAFEDENAVAIPDLNNPGHWIVYFKNLSGEESNVASLVTSSSKTASTRSAASKGTRRHADLGANTPKRGQPLVVRHPTDQSKDEIVFKYPPRCQA